MSRPLARSRLPLFAPWLALAFYAVVILRCAWMSDDAYVTLRTVDNILSGHGPIWNPGERVQAYTHPLWMIVLTIANVLSRDPFVMTMLLGVGVSVGAVGLAAFRIGKTSGYAVLLIVALVMSRSFVDYSTSGLENPLSHLLVAAIYLAYLNYDGSAEQLTRLVLWSTLLTLNRLDLVLIALFPLAEVLRRTPWRTAIRPLLIGSAPLVLWELFSLIYYGSLVPNTALAKLGNGLGAARMWRQGGVYLMHQLEFDPLSLALIAAAVFVGIVQVRRDIRHSAMALGILMYVVYVCKVGGDFMAGRFFSVPAMASVCLVTAVVRSAGEPDDRDPQAVEARTWVERGHVAWGCAWVAAIGSLAHTPGPFLGPLTALILPSGIVDERQFWGRSHHLIGVQTTRRAPYHGVTQDGRRVRRRGDKVAVRQAVGAFGYHAGPDVYIIDRYALGDAFLARLPVAKVGAYARPGHNPRFVPPDYVISLETGEYDLLDPKLEELWAKVRLVTSGPLFSADRWAAIWELNTGGAADLVDREFYARPFYGEVPLWVLSDPKNDGYGWDQPGVVFVDPVKGLAVELDGIRTSSTLSVVADHNDEYTVGFLLGDQRVGEAKINRVGDPSRVNLQTRTVVIPPNAQKSGFDALVFEPHNKADYGYSIGYIKFLGGPDDHKSEPPPLVVEEEEEPGDEDVEGFGHPFGEPAVP